MRAYETPGIYNEREDASRGGIAALRTDVTGMVGIAGRGPRHVAVPVESPRQFNAWFGPPIDQGYLAYAARAFFENGGRRLWCTRVASLTAAFAFTSVDDAGQPAWRIEASSDGVWGNAVAVRLVERRRTQIRGRIDAADPRVIHGASVAGLDRLALVELGAGALVGCAVVTEVDASLSRFRIDRVVPGLGVSASILVETITYSLDVFESGRLTAQYPDLSIIVGHPRYGPRILKQPWTEVDTSRPENPTLRAPEPDLATEYFRSGGNRGAVAPPLVVIRELRDQPARDALRPLTTVRRLDRTTLPVRTEVPSAVLLEAGADGLGALGVDDFLDGLRALEVVNEVSILAVPDIHIQPRVPNPVVSPRVCEPGGCLPSDIPASIPSIVLVGDIPPRFPQDQVYQVQAAAVGQCERLRDRVALLDAPFEACSRLTFAASELRAWRARFDSKFAALYAPWVSVVDPLRARGRGIQGPTRAIPPSGHVAGQAAGLDLRSGVHVAPANTPLEWVQSVSLDLSEPLHGLLNISGVNAIRAQSGRGVRVLGARTMSSDPDWRFLNVRRLMSMIEKAIDASIQWAVFESNDWRTRAKLTLAIQSLLVGLWRRGAMVGAVPAEAFFVRCDDTNNPPDARARGQLLIEVGIAPSVPFEFVVLRIGRDANGFTMSSGEPVAAAT